jgi:hypothetical protein
MGGSARHTAHRDIGTAARQQAEPMGRAMAGHLFLPRDTLLFWRQLRTTVA